jgi:hypothetical protein
LEAEKKEEDDAMGDIGSAPVQQGPIIPPLDQEQEYEWKWRVSLSSLHECTEVGLMDIAKDGGFEENFLFVDSLVYLCMYLSLSSLYQQRCSVFARSRHDNT